MLVDMCLGIISYEKYGHEGAIYILCHEHIFYFIADDSYHVCELRDYEFEGVEVDSVTFADLFQSGFMYRWDTVIKEKFETV